MTVEDIKKEIEAMGWEHWMCPPNSADPCWIAQIWQHGKDMEVLGNFWGGTAIEAAQAALSWLKERGE